jgi:hypothetical protein
MKIRFKNNWAWMCLFTVIGGLAIGDIFEWSETWLESFKYLPSYWTGCIYIWYLKKEKTDEDA